MHRWHITNKPSIQPPFTLPLTSPPPSSLLSFYRHTTGGHARTGGTETNETSTEGTSGARRKVRYTSDVKLVMIANFTYILITPHHPSPTTTTTGHMQCRPEQ